MRDDGLGGSQVNTRTRVRGVRRGAADEHTVTLRNMFQGQWDFGEKLMPYGTITEQHGLSLTRVMRRTIDDDLAIVSDLDVAHTSRTALIAIDLGLAHAIAWARTESAERVDEAGEVMHVLLWRYYVGSFRRAHMSDADLEFLREHGASPHLVTHASDPPLRRARDVEVALVCAVLKQSARAYHLIRGLDTAPPSCPGYSYHHFRTFTDPETRHAVTLLGFVGFTPSTAESRTVYATAAGLTWCDRVDRLLAWAVARGIGVSNEYVQSLLSPWRS